VAHCSYDYLADLKDCLAEIRHWPAITKRRPGIFYLGRHAFLHFHLSSGIRSADVRAGKDWGELVDIPIGATAAAQRRFLAELRRRYKVTLNLYRLPAKKTKKSSSDSRSNNKYRL